LLVVRRGQIVTEWYAPGHTAARRHYTASLAKSLVGGMALLVALGDDRIGVDDLAWRTISSWKGDALKSQITIRHLATHSSGLEDAETPGKSHLEQEGWKLHFWQREPDPFSVALDANRSMTPSRH
jgi:CubicO group peptidase (beta-lactamase class C family)